jgi:E3 ubiquitin-protein ligase mind-bomb
MFRLVYSFKYKYRLKPKITFLFVPFLYFKKTLGQVGKIVKIYSDNDLKIEVCGTTWTYNPLAVSKYNESKNSKIVLLKDLNEGKTLVYISVYYFEKYQNINIYLELAKAAASGDCEKCEYILNLPGADVITFLQ